jgi:hypothetical protein
VNLRKDHYHTDPRSTLHSAKRKIAQCLCDFAAACNRGKFRFDSIQLFFSHLRSCMLRDLSNPSPKTETKLILDATSTTVWKKLKGNRVHCHNHAYVVVMVVYRSEKPNQNIWNNNFQRRMSRLPQRWRTQRNAIRNANCNISWIIKILNAHCASGIFPGACLFEC